MVQERFLLEQYQRGGTETEKKKHKLHKISETGGLWPRATYLYGAGMRRSVIELVDFVGPVTTEIERYRVDDDMRANAGHTRVRAIEAIELGNPLLWPCFSRALQMQTSRAQKV